MARDWVKLHTGMLGHVGTMRLSDRAFRLWVVLLMMAGMADDGGYAGTVGDLAFYLRWTEDEVRAALDEMNGRVVLEDGHILVRDWSDWQPKMDRTNAERQSRYRQRQRAEDASGANAESDVDITPPHNEDRGGGVTEGVTPLRNAVTVAETVTPLRNAERNAVTVTEGVTPLRNEDRNTATRAPEPEEPEEPEEPPLTPPRGERWAAFYDAERKVFGEQTTHTKRGQVRAFCGQLALAFGEAANRDVSQAVGLLRAWVKAEQQSGGWDYVTPRNAVSRAEKWLAGRRTKQPRGGLSL